MNYHELSIENRLTIRISQAHSLSQQAISNLLNRSPSTVSRELRRNADTKQPRVAPVAQSQTVKRRKAKPPGATAIA
jgi:IS30 family transposase